MKKYIICHQLRKDEMEKLKAYCMEHNCTWNCPKLIGDPYFNGLLYINESGYIRKGLDTFADLTIKLSSTPSTVKPEEIVNAEDLFNGKVSLPFFQPIPKKEAPKKEAPKKALDLNRFSLMDLFSEVFPHFNSNIIPPTDKSDVKEKDLVSDFKGHKELESLYGELKGLADYLGISISDGNQKFGPITFKESKVQPKNDALADVIAEVYSRFNRSRIQPVINADKDLLELPACIKDLILDYAKRKSQE